MRFRKLSEVAPPSASRAKPAPTETVWHLTLDQIEPGSGHISRRTYGRVSDAGSSTFAFDTGNVLYSKLRPYLNKVICPDTGGIATTELIPLRPVPEELNREFLCFYLRSPEFVAWASAQVDGAKMPRMKMKSFWAHEIPIPPLDDQIRIAHLLGKVEGLIAQRKQHLQQLDDLLKSVFLEMFGPTNSDHEVWPLVEIRELAANHKGAMRTGPFGSNLLHSEFTPEGDVAVLGIDNAVQNRFVWGERRFISNDKYQELQSYRIFPGDVIVTIMGTIGRSAVIPDDIPVAINTKHLAAITLNREVANPLFLSYSIHSSPSVLKQFASKNRGAIMSGLNLGIIKETKIKRPPVGLQNRFAEIHVRVDQLKSSYQQSLTDLESLYGALSQKAFKGELDLSRVPMPSIPVEKEKTESAESEQASGEQALAINLPNPEVLLDALDGDKAGTTREGVIVKWLLEVYRNHQLGNRAFSAQRFMADVQTGLGELQADKDFTWGINEYEHIKAWVFNALNAGTLTQAFDDAGNRVELKAAQA